MSVIVVVRDDTTAVIAADTLTHSGSLRSPRPWASGQSKLVEVPGGVLGTVGSTATHLVMRSLVARYRDRFDFSSEDAIFESLRGLHPVMIEEYFTREDEADEEQPYDSNQLFGLYAGTSGIYCIQSYREVIEYERFWAVGSGQALALGAMFASQQQGDPPDVTARVGVEAACTFDASCGLPMELRTIPLAPRR